MKHYKFLSKYYTDYFKNVLTRYHCDFFISSIASDTLQSLQLLGSGVDDNQPNLVSSVTCMYLNARSITNKMDVLKSYSNANKPDIIAITETWAKPETPDGFYTIPGYKLFRNDRLDRRGGGVIIHINETVGSSQIHFCSYSDFEFLSFKLHLYNGKFAGVLCIYRPPNITDTGDVNLINLIETFLCLNYHYNIIIGDFNMPSIDWKSFSAPLNLWAS